MTTIQLQIGNLAGYSNREALVPYDQNSAIVLIHNSATQVLATDLCESFALQLLQQHPIGQAKVLLYEATPSRQFSQLKRLYAQTQKQLGEQFFSVQGYISQLMQFNELAHRRFALFATAHVPDITHYNATAYRAETVIYLLIIESEVNKATFVPRLRRSSLYIDVQVRLVPTCYVGTQCWTRCVPYKQTRCP